MENPIGKNNADLESRKIQSRTTHRESKGEQHGRWNWGHMVLHEVFWLGRENPGYKQAISNSLCKYQCG